MTLPTARWLTRVDRDDGPIYLAILKALESAIVDGDLQAGEQLPPQRAVAVQLGVDFTTVTRAYAAARARGMVEGAVGRGTFVRGRASEDEAGLIDLSMNLPPPPLDLSLGRLLKETSRAVLDRTDPAALMAYHPGAGSLAQRAAGAAWLAPTLGEVSPEAILVSPGAQTALAALFTTLMRPGDALIVEPLTYPGALSLAAHLGLRLIACPTDDEGVLPAELDRLCAEHRPKAIYLIPTLQNPVATTMGPQRRGDVARVAQSAQVPIIEDDAYGRLPQVPPPAIAALTPRNVWHVATTAKALSPGLRTAFVAAPSADQALRLATALRAMSLMASPLTTAVATAWIREGTAERLLAAVRAETRARQTLARDILPSAVGGPDGVHVWLDLAPGRDPSALRDDAARRGLSLVTAQAFAAGPGARDGLRISLGGPARREVLAQALRAVADLLA
ncbi:PLP-dependent aminotransferase family protein [Phenylobacterium sp.]|uniref:aminotransferase-like domain-containing protein n=1 Tax=Phenylobacterium sp. TaxID=1871053 RepID=UPI00286A9796|nr:PLP-dependent aminotransferase family protein [Phenylobacterium sp.]